MLMRFDPFREADRLADQALAALRARSGPMAMDAYRRGDEVRIQVDLPGVDPSTIDLVVEKNVLSVTAERRPTYGADDEVVLAERSYGQLSRQLFLGEGLDPDRVAARYEDGVLTVTIPVAEQARPRRVEITTPHQVTAVATSSGAEHAAEHSEPAVAATSGSVA
jgi:HSP20 family protein